MFLRRGQATTERSKMSKLFNNVQLISLQAFMVHLQYITSACPHTITDQQRRGRHAGDSWTHCHLWVQEADLERWINSTRELVRLMECHRFNSHKSHLGYYNIYLLPALSLCCRSQSVCSCSVYMEILSDLHKKNLFVLSEV